MGELFKNNYFFFFETNKFDKENHRSYYFLNPVKIVRLEDPGSVDDFLNEFDELTKKYYTAGFFSYELGYCLEEAFKDKIKTSFPPALFCAYEKPAIYDHNTGRFISGNFDLHPGHADYKINNLRLNITKDEYKENVEKVRDYIRKGDIYQANYTIKYNFDFSGSPMGLYRDLKAKQYVAYNVFAGFDDFYILSLSPELFFRKKGNKITVRPMKGTYRRGRNSSEDKENGEFLACDEKNRSENVMIVDLLRNDIGKVCESGSVKTTKLYEIEKYNSLFQMTSTVEGILEKDLPAGRLIRSIFPSGSITGAPKIRSMEIIRELEKEERKIYTGSIGFFEPSGDSVFNVAIRTILIQGNKGEMGVGGAIVYDSTAEDEFQECELKARFLLQKPAPEFSIIETMLFDEKYLDLDLHINRMRESAEYFDYLFDENALRQKLDGLRKSMPDGKHKVRLLLDRSGRFTVTYVKPDTGAAEYKIRLSEKRVDSSNIFLFHKTTSRELYEIELNAARQLGFFDIIFMNEKNEITEGAITNFYIKAKGEIFTPPLDCGLLNGTIRQSMLGKGKVIEKRINLQDIKQAEAFYISNAIIGFKEAVFISKNTTHPAK